MRKWYGEYSRKGAGGERMRRRSPHCGGHDAVAPECSAQPEANLGRAALDVLLEHEADPADGLFGYGNREVDDCVAAGCHLDPRVSVLRRVRMRKAIAEIAPYFAGIGMPDESGLITVTPGPKLEAVAVYVHGNGVFDSAC